jgi:aminoacrylate hydrolase
MPVVPVRDGEIYYETHGDGPPLMMVAGLGGVGSYWTPNLPRFAAHCRVILHDQRGTGRSSRVPVRSIGQMADDAVQLMDHLGIGQCAWLGHSTGAAIGADLALDHPGRISRLVLNSSTTHGDAYRHKLFGVRRTLHAAAGPAAYASFTSLLLYPPWYINQHAGALAAEEARAAAGIAAPEIQASRLDAILAWDRRAALPGLQTPVLVICAEDDILTPIAFSEGFARLIPGAVLHRLATGGHACSRTVPEVFEPAVLEFLLGPRAAA